MVATAHQSAVAAAIQKRYRLQPEDLLDGPREVTIVNTSLEGLETLRPVLHFDAVAKPLVLSPGMANELARITGTAVMDDWIGWTIKLTVVEGSDGLDVLLLAPQTPTAKPVYLTQRSREARRRRTRTLLIVLLLILIFLAVYVMEETRLTTLILEAIFGDG